MTGGEKIVQILENLIVAKVQEMHPDAEPSDALRVMNLKKELADQIDFLEGLTP